MSAGYSGTPLPKKLGINPGFVVVLDGAPLGFEKTLGALPDGASISRSIRSRRNLTLGFIRSRAELERRILRLARFAKASGLWLCWPKKSSGIVSDVNENVIRDAALESGLVDFKVAALDATWSGLRFSMRKAVT